MTKRERLDSILRIIDTLELHGTAARQHLNEAIKQLDKGEKNLALVLMRQALWELYHQTKPCEFARNHVKRIARSTSWKASKTGSNNGENKA